MLRSARIHLRPVTLDDTDRMIAWRNNPFILDTVFNPRPITREQHEAWYHQLINNSERIEFIIAWNDSSEPIGRIGLDHIDYHNQKAEYSISIGETGAWGKGLGAEATHLVLDYGFRELNLNKIYLKVFEENQRAVQLYKKMGFVAEGVLAEEYFKQGEFKTILYMSILRKNYHPMESI